MVFSLFWNFSLELMFIKFQLFLKSSRMDVLMRSYGVIVVYTACNFIGLATAVILKFCVRAVPNVR